MSELAGYPEVKALADRARAMQAAHDTCEASGGHYYTVDGFSAIAHPETGPPLYGLPNVRSLNDVVFRGYVCRNCGRRVSVEEGRAYMQDKPLGEAEERRRLDELTRGFGIDPDLYRLA
jgi:hypothetical protein